MARNFVICSDGTGQKYGPIKSNVARLFKVLDLTDRGQKIGCYDAGLGTFPDRETIDAIAMAQPNLIQISSKQSKPTQLAILKEQLFGNGLIENVRQM